MVEGVVAQGISDQRQHDRRDLLAKLNTLDHAAAGDPAWPSSARPRTRPTT